MCANVLEKTVLRNKWWGLSYLSGEAPMLEMLIGRCVQLLPHGSADVPHPEL